MTEEVEPTYLAGSFTCPHCGALTGQTWSGGRLLGTIYVDAGTCQAASCSQSSVWIATAVDGAKHLAGPTILVWPPTRLGPIPNPDLADDIRADLEEARSILQASPRGAAALARLAVQKMLMQLGKAGKNINDDIGSLVKDGLPPQAQKALDVVRVTGNNAVHPGTIDMADNQDAAVTILRLINVIAERLITTTKEIDDLFGALPEGVHEQIQRRDGAE